jgi:hypothetical protein
MTVMAKDMYFFVPASAQKVSNLTLLITCLSVSALDFKMLPKISGEEPHVCFSAPGLIFTNTLNVDKSAACLLASGFWIAPK